MYALYKGRCTLANIFKNVVASHFENFDGDELVGRFIGVRTDLSEGALEGCLRVSFEHTKLLDELLTSFMRHRILYRIVYKSKSNIVLWFKHGGNVCKICPVVHATSGITPKAMLVTPLGLLFEFILRDRSNIDENSFHILVSGSADEMMDYMLTAKEQEALYYAYSRGYYSQPRKITLRRLAFELGLSKSTLNEILRSAERKILTAYMRHDLPHLIVNKVLTRKAKVHS
jgi:hypothetical protein